MDGTSAAAEISFVKTMAKSSFKALTIPASFIREHGDKFKINCKLGYGHSKPRWEVKVQVYFMKKYPHVSFGAGWKAFAQAHDIHEGDVVKFELVEQSGFTVAPITPNEHVVINLSSDEE